MTPPRIVSSLWFDGDAADAVRFYREVLPEAQAGATSHYPGSRENPGGLAPGTELTVSFAAGGCAFTTINGGPHFKPNPSVSFFVEVAGEDAVNRLVARLALGGQTMMPLGSYPWSERYAWVADRFGFSWQVMLARAPGAPPTIAPALTFGGERARAEEAVRAYAEIFPASRVLALVSDQGRVSHARVELAGQTFVAMDAGSAFTERFNEAISFQVMCRDQAEVDRYHAALSAGGAESRCGWVKDRFGVSWQIVPVDMPRWMASGDRAARDRAFQALLTMKKIDISAMEKAFGDT